MGRSLSEQDLRDIERRCQAHRGRLERSRLVAAWTQNARPLLVAGLTALILLRIAGLPILWLAPTAIIALAVALWRAWRARSWSVPAWKLPAILDHRSGARGSLMMALDGELDPSGVLGDTNAVALTRPPWRQSGAAWGSAAAAAVLCVAVPLPNQHTTPVPVTEARAVIDAISDSGEGDAFVDSAKETLDQLARAETLEPEDFEALERIQREARARLHARLDANELERALLRELDAILERAPGQSREQTARELAAAKRGLERVGSERGAELASKAQSLTSSLKNGGDRPKTRGGRAPSSEQLGELRRRVQSHGQKVGAAMVATATALEQHGGGTPMTRTLLAQATAAQTGAGQRGQSAGKRGQQGTGQPGAGQQGGQPGAGQQGSMASNGSDAFGAAGISRGPGSAPMVFRRRAIAEGKVADIALPRGGDRAEQIVSTTWGAMPEAGTRDESGESDAVFNRGSDSPYWDKRMLPRHRDVVRTYFRLATEK